MGDFKKAQEFLEQSLVIYKKNLPDDHTEIAWVLVQLGDIYRNLGKYHEAEDLLKQGLRMYEVQFGKDHIEVAWVLAYLGKVYREVGNHEKSMSLINKGQSLQKVSQVNKLDEDIENLDISQSHNEVKSHQKAKELLEESLTTFEKQFGINHISTARIIVYLAEFYKDSGNYEQAEALIKQCLRIYTDNFGKDHLKTARALRNLGEIYFLKGQILIAERQLKRAVKIFTKYDHPEAYKALECLTQIALTKSMNEGNINNIQDNKMQAINYQRRALKIVQTHFPSDSPHITRIQASLNSLEAV